MVSNPFLYWEVRGRDRGEGSIIPVAHSTENCGDGRQMWYWWESQTLTDLTKVDLLFFFFLAFPRKCPTGERMESSSGIADIFAGGSGTHLPTLRCS